MNHVPYPDELPDCSDDFFPVLVTVIATLVVGLVLGWVAAVTIYC